MSLYKFPNITSGADTFLVSISAQVNPLVPMLLLFVFFTILIGGAVSQKRRIGTADLPMWATVSSMATLMIALALTLKEGLINVDHLAIVVVITLFSGAWLFMTRNRNEI